MVKPEEKSLTAPLPLTGQSSAAGTARRPLHHHNPAVRKAVAARTSVAAAASPLPAAAGQVPIVRAQIRLPNEQLAERFLAGEGGGGGGGSSGPATPVLGRKLLAELEGPSSKAGADKRVPKSVASMVRRFELESGADTKTRAGYKYESCVSSRASTPGPDTPQRGISPACCAPEQEDDHLGRRSTTPISSRSSSLSDTQSPGYNSTVTAVNSIANQSANIKPVEDEVLTTAFKLHEADRTKATAATTCFSSKEGATTVSLQMQQPTARHKPAVGRATAQPQQHTVDKKKSTSMPSASSTLAGVEKGSKKSAVSTKETQRKITTTGKSAVESAGRPGPLKKRDSVGATGSQAIKKTSTTVIAPAKSSAAEATATSIQNKVSKPLAQKKSAVVERKSFNATTKKVSVERQQTPHQQDVAVPEDLRNAGGVADNSRRASVAVRLAGKGTNQLVASKGDQKQSAEEGKTPAKPRQALRPLSADISGSLTIRKQPSQAVGEAKVVGSGKNASLDTPASSTGPVRAPHHRPIEKSDSSVSLTRKKFEKKVENNEETPRMEEGTRKLTEPLMPRLKISQNLFLKEDALHRNSNDSQSRTHRQINSQAASRPKAKTLEVVGTGSRQTGSSQKASQPALSQFKDHTSGSAASNIHESSSSVSDLVPTSTQYPGNIDCSSYSSLVDPSSCSTPAGHVPATFPVVIQIHADKEGKAGLTPEDSLGVNSTVQQADMPANHLVQSDAMAVGNGPPSERVNLGTLDSLDLPESPAYRSPLLSESDDEGEIDEASSVSANVHSKSSSRHHVLEAFVGSTSGSSSEETGLRHRLLSNLVNKRSESDGIVCMDRPRTDRPIRRCESIDDGLELMGSGVGGYQQRQTVDLGHMPFPQSIKTVTPATILKGPEDYTAGLGETVYLRTHYFGNPEPRVAWFRGGRRITVQAGEDADAIGEEQRIRIRTYPGESTLVIRDLRADDSGKYEIQIENEVGNDACSASLCVEGPPEPPGGRPYITTIDRDLKRLTLAWYGSTFDGGSMLTGYIVEMSSWPIVTDASQPEPTDWTVVTSKCHSTSYIVRELAADKEYIFRVRAQNIHGQSAPGKVSEPVSFNKIEDEDEDSLLDDESGPKKPGSEDGKDDSEDEEEFESPFKHRHVVLEEGSIFKDKFEIYEELGRGRFGVVFKVKNRETREIFAAKFVKCRKQEERDKCKEEIEIMNGLDHSRLLQLAAAYENPREVIMIMEFIGGGELFEKVVADDFTLTEHDCVLFMRQICAAIGYMHQKDIVHLDLKPENILCKSKKSHQIKIIDFGLTRKLKPGEDVRILFGTPEFVSPEVISYEPVSAASDMWSVGVVCYVLLSGLSPFMGDSDVETFSNITGLCYDFEDDAFEHISEDAKDFILNLLIKDQRKRLKALECLKHPWLNQRQSDKKAWKEINTDKLKSFLMRRRWQKAAHAIRALGRFTSLGFRQDSKDSASSISGLSTQSADF